jgi:predicted alpha/beta-fold hydrolase
MTENGGLPRDWHTVNMRSFQTVLALATFLCIVGSLPAQQPHAISADPAPTKPTTRNVETVIPSHGSKLTGLFLLAGGAEPHGTVLLLHGFPGYEQNMDLAQAIRRDGWNVLAMHYRGSWGAEGSFTLILAAFLWSATAWADLWRQWRWQNIKRLPAG